MKKQIITLLSAAILLCGVSASAFATENAEPEAGAAVTETEDAAAAVAQEDVSANYPVVSDFENTATGIRVYWKAYNGAARYGLFYLGEDGWHGIATTSALNMEYENLSSGVEYTFTVRALNSNGDFISDYNHEGWSHTFTAPPVITDISNTPNGVSIKWNALTGEKKYRVYRKDDNHGWARIGDTAETTFTDRNAASGTRYSYTVRAITADGSRETTYFNSGKSILYVAMPKVTEILNRDGSADIYWNSCKGASQYRVFYLDNGTVTPLLKKMEEAELVKRCRSKEDERMVTVTVTEKGWALRESAKDIPFRVGTCVPLTQSEAETLYRLIHTFLEKIDNSGSN